MSLKPITRKEKFLAQASGEDIKNLEPITREEKFLAQLKSGGGSVISYNDLIDKPFGEIETCFVPEQTVVFQDLGMGMPVAMLTGDIKEPTVGTTCTVKWGSETYESVVANVTNSVCVGNAGAMTGGESSGEPFVIVLEKQDGVLMAVAILISGDPVDTIAINGVSIKTIDPKYIKIEEPVYDLTKVVDEITVGTEWSGEEEFKYIELVNLCISGRFILKLTLIHAGITRYLTVPVTPIYEEAIATGYITTIITLDDGAPILLYICAHNDRLKINAKVLATS